LFLPDKLSNKILFIKNDGTASTSGNFVINAAGNIQTTNNQTLTIGGSTTGNIVLSPRNNAGSVLPGTDNTVTLGASSSARFKDLYLGAGSLHIQCLTGDGCGQNVDLSQSINTTTGNFEIGFNSTTANNKNVFSLSPSGNLSLGKSGLFNGVLTFQSSGGGTAPSISANSSGALVIAGGSGDVTIGESGSATNIVYQESAAFTAAAGKTVTIGGTNAGVIFNFGDGSTAGTYNFNRTNATYNFGNMTGAVTLTGGITGGNAALILNQNGASGNDIFAASASGVTKFTIKNDGTASSAAGFTINGAGTIQSTNNQSLTLGGGSTGDLTIGRASQNLFLPAFTTNGGLLYTTSTGLLTQLGAGSTGQCLTANTGAAPTWGSCDAASSVNVWDIRSGTAQLATVSSWTGLSFQPIMQP
jgi:hypothetical protein